VQEQEQQQEQQEQQEHEKQQGGAGVDGCRLLPAVPATSCQLSTGPSAAVLSALGCGHMCVCALAFKGQSR
jgi:hypothetical protein